MVVVEAVEVVVVLIVVVVAAVVVVVVIEVVLEAELHIRGGGISCHKGNDACLHCRLDVEPCIIKSLMHENIRSCA